MPTVKINNINMFYEMHGQGEPLVLVSGFGADNLAWTYILNQLTPHYQVLVFDNRGAGKTDVPTGAYSIEQMAHDVEALCQHVGFKQAHFVGNSMGGYIVQMIAHRYPALVKSLVISNSAMGSQGVFHFYLAAQLELLKANAPRHALLKSTCAWLFSYHFLSQPNQLESLVQLGLNNPYPFTMTGHEGQYAALVGFDSHKWLQTISAPALVIGANQDIIFPMPLAQAMHKTIPNSIYYCFENCGHLPFLEYPEKFTLVIKAFFEQNK